MLGERKYNNNNNKRERFKVFKFQTFLSTEALQSQTRNVFNSVWEGRGGGGPCAILTLESVFQGQKQKDAAMSMCQEQAGADRALGVPDWQMWTLQDLAAALPSLPSSSQLLPVGTMLGTELHSIYRATLA